MYKHIPVFAAVLFSAAAFGDGATKAADTSNPIGPPTAATKVAAVSTFESLDKNGDQRISRTEAGVDKNLSNIFATADTDGDGYVSKAEFAARPQG
jgi:hypothetical protein